MKPKFIVVASSKGGVGKSTVALGVSLALSEMGESVLLADLDFGNACLDILAGCENSVVYTVLDVAAKRCAAEDAVIEAEGIYLLPCPAGGKTEISEEGDCTASGVIDAVKAAAESGTFTYVVMDTSAGVNEVTDEAVKIADMTLVVSGHNPISLRAAESSVARFAPSARGEIRLIVNQFDIENLLSGKGRRSGLLHIIDSSRAQLFGVVPYDYGLMLKQEGAKVKKTGAEIAFSNIAKRLRGYEVPVFDTMKKIRRKRNKLYR